MSKTNRGNLSNIDELLVQKKTTAVKSKFSIDLLAFFSQSSSIEKSPNCGISSNCHGSSSTCCNRH